ncbi:MAG: tetratricopeptide repeat protein, partial [Bdellovibrionales bacterium]|nr:tetratricopeptide repeat protein [Bdellovibrionales bacterium]
FELSWGNLERALDINPSDETALDLLVEWGVKESKFDILIDRLELFLQAQPHHIHMKETLVKVLLVGGRVKKAEQLLDAIVKEDPRNSAMQEMLKILKQNNQLHGAVSD